MIEIKTTLNELAQKIFKANVEKGFWPEDVNDRNKGEALMLVVSELAEALEADREHEYAYFEEFEKALGELKEADPDIHNQLYAQLFEEFMKNSFEDEIADTIIRLLDISAGYGINIDKHIEYKLIYNKTRPHKHGKSY